MESIHKLSTPEEEIAYLREQVAQKEKELQKTKEENSAAARPSREEIISEQIHSHKAAGTEMLASTYRISETWRTKLR